MEEHELTHLPFRSCCKHCVRGRGKDMPHSRVTEEPNTPEMHCDLCFLWEEGGPGNTVPVLVMGERTTRMTMAAAVPRKGAVGEFAPGDGFSL